MEPLVSSCVWNQIGLPDGKIKKWEDLSSILILSIYLLAFGIFASVG